MQEVIVPIDDTIDFKAVFSTIWSKKRVLLVWLALISLVFWFVMLGVHLLKPKVVTFTKQIQLTFSGLEKDTYPNGTPFSISDIIAPAILNQIYEKNNLAQFKLSRESFLQAFSVEPYAPDRNLILKKYQTVVEQKGITSAELSEAQESLRNELKKSSMDNVKIYFTIPESLAFPKNLAEKILQAVPEAWARFEVEKRGVLKLDVPFYSEKLLDTKMLLNRDYLIMDELLRDQLKQFQSNLVALSEFPGGNVVQDDQTGLTLPELQRTVYQIERYDLPEVMVPIRSLAIAKQPEVVRLFFDGQLRELTSERDRFVKAADVVREAYRAYTQQQEMGKTAESTSKESSGLEGSRAFPTMTPQISEGFLDNLVKLSKRADDVEYRQKLNSQVMEYLEKAAVLDVGIERIKKNISLLNSQTSGTLKEAVRKTYIGRADQKIPEILERLRSYIRMAENIAKKLGIENYGYTGLLFKGGSGVGFILDGGIAWKRSLLWYVFVILATLFLIVPIVVIREMWRQEG